MKDSMLMQVKKSLDAMMHPLYLIRGRKPWTAGYYTEKRRSIEKAIDNHLLAEGKSLPEAYGFRLDERVVEYPWVYARLDENPGKMLDAGSALNHDFLLSRLPLNHAKLSICTLAPERRCYFQAGISYVFDDLRASMFRSDYFDTVVSISTIEHIGLDNTLLYTSDSTKDETDNNGFLEAVKEFKRVLRPGGTCFITVPFGKAVVREWFQLFDESMIQMIIDEFGPSQYEVEYFGYGSEGWKFSDAGSLENSTFFDIHQDTPYDDDYAAGARGVCCLKLIA